MQQRYYQYNIAAEIRLGEILHATKFLIKAKHLSMCSQKPIATNQNLCWNFAYHKNLQHIEIFVCTQFK